MSFIRFVIPDSIRNPVFLWIPAFAGMTGSGTINVVVYKSLMFIISSQYSNLPSFQYSNFP